MATPNMAVELVGHQEEEPWTGCRLARRDKPSAGAGQVVVRVQCRPVNPSDVSCIRGHYGGWNPTSSPPVLGFEGMGIIDQIGEGVTGFEVGQRVYPLGAAQQGMWQDYVVAPASGLVPVPPSVPDEVAAQFVVNPWSVVGLVEVLNVPKGEYLLQTAAGSVLGRMLIQYTHYKGIKTINIVRRSDQVDELKALGGDEVVVSTQDDVVEKVKQITGGKMAHSAVDCVGGDTTEMVSRCVRDGSTVLVYGGMGDSCVKIPIGCLLFNHLTVKGFHLSHWVSTLSQSQLKEVGKLVMGLLQEKVLIPMVGEKFPLDKFQDAIKKSLESARGGKVFLVSY